MSNPIPKKSRDAVRYRSKGQCEFANDEHIRCRLRATELHHIDKRSRGDHSPENLVYLCLWCHETVHAHPQWSEAHGYIKRAGPVNLGLKNA